MKLLFSLLFGVGFSASLVGQPYVDYYQEGVAAYEQENYQLFLESFIKADSLRPNHRVILYNLAAGYALNNQLEKAFETLSYRIDFYAVNDFEDDKDFTSFSDSNYLDVLQKKIEEATVPKKTSTTAFEVTIEGFHAEGIAFNKSNSRFYLTDIRNGWIYSVGLKGEEPRLEVDLKEFGYWSAMGIKFDPENPNHIWVTTSAIPNFIGYEDSLKGLSAILNINLDSSELIKAYSIGGNHVFGDLIFAKDGSLFISDSGEPIIHKVDSKKKELVEFLSNPEWWNLQGLALSVDQQTLYVSDYITGIFKVDLKTKNVSLFSQKNQLLRGADGIYFFGNQLLMLQNGSVPMRLASIHLDEQENGITSTLNYLDNALPELDEPTLGVLVGSSLYYIANSPWSYYDDETNPIVEKWIPLKINRLSLE